tara:strand:+ start:200 stop:2395 length:2196 start_codon:yes stop_codon:yes gene_type:complete
MNKTYNENIDKILSQKYLSYAISTIISRSLPDVRDGLKPVHRRIIFSMYQLKLFNNSSYKKSARIVGDVMGKFHPHGDQAIYDSLVRMAQDFSTRIKLIDGQGNFGNIDGDNPAAMRYTEARLQKYSDYFFDGIEENSVDFKENYDGQNLEPEVLPSQLPNILINGAMGIAVGMATNIPPHNVKELVDCLLLLINNPNSNISKLMKTLNGPDFPTGGEVILNQKEKKEIYTKGRGSFIINSNWFIEDLKNGMYQIVINEIPYQVNKIKIIEQLANLINTKKIPLDDVIDESDENIRIVLKPKNRNIEAKKLIELCFKLTDLSIKYSCNFNVLINGIEPQQTGLVNILLNFLDHRKISIKRKSEFNIEKIKKRLEILKGYQIVFKNLDKIIKIIRTKDHPKKELIKKFKLTELQADSILSMRLGSLKKIDEKNIFNEILDLNKELKFLKKLISDKKTLNQYISNELINILNEIDPLIKNRKTNILQETIYSKEVDIDEFKEIEKYTIILNKDHNLKRVKDHVSFDDLKKNNKDIRYSIKLLSNQKLILFVSSGKVFSIDPNDIPGGNSNPKSFIYFIDCQQNDKVVGIMSSDNDKIFSSSKNGKGFVSNIKKLITNQRKGKQFFNLKNNDEVIKVFCIKKSHLICVTKLQKMLAFDLATIPELQKGVGVQLIKIKDEDFLSDVIDINPDEGLEWNTGSKKRKIDNIKNWLGKRSQSGKKIPKFFNKNLKFSE